MIIRVMSTVKEDNIYYRYTCEKCGFHSHWITYTVVGSACRTVSFTENQNALAALLQNGAQQRLHGSMRMYEAQIRECLAGRRADSRDDYTIYNIFKLAEKCPRCGHQPSWLPVQKLFRAKAEKYNAQTPMLSEPDIMFGGERPEDDDGLLDKPCALTICHAQSVTSLNALPTWIYLNDVSLGEANSGFALNVQTRFADNLITIQNESGMALLSYYFTAESSGAKMIRYSGRNFEISKVPVGSVSRMDAAAQ